MTSLKAEVALEWGDGDFMFALKGDQIEELQSVCGDVGFGAIYQRVVLGVWKWGDLYHIIRLGLIGGGMGAIEAKRKVDFYMGKENPIPLIGGPNNPETVARAILGAAMHGFAGLDRPKGEAAAGESPAGGTSLNSEQPLSETESTPAP